MKYNYNKGEMIIRRIACPTGISAFKLAALVAACAWAGGGGGGAAPGPLRMVYKHIHTYNIRGGRSVWHYSMTVIEDSSTIKLPCLPSLRQKVSPVAERK